MEVFFQPIRFSLSYVIVKVNQSKMLKSDVIIVQYLCNTFLIQQAVQGAKVAVASLRLDLRTSWP